MSHVLFTYKHALNMVRKYTFVTEHNHRVTVSSNHFMCVQECECLTVKQAKEVKQGDKFMTISDNAIVHVS